MDEADDLRRRVQARLREQRRVVATLLQARAQVPGSLFMRYGQCGKAGCACRRGPGHGPYYVLSQRSRGKGGFAYLDAPRAREARALVARARAFRVGLRRLQRLNLELLDLLRRYQIAMARRGGQRLGLAARAS